MARAVPVRVTLVGHLPQGIGLPAGLTGKSSFGLPQIRRRRLSPRRIVCELRTVVRDGSTDVARASRSAVRSRISLMATGLLLAVAQAALAVSPDSPEVVELVNLGLKHLESKSHVKLGGKCLIGLCFLKAGKREHPRVAEALSACQKASSAGSPDAYVQGDDNVYSNGIAVIFLCELDARRHAELVQFFLTAMQARQKADGSWGYNGRASGDTSQTQYGALAYWEAHRRGFALEADSVERAANWLSKVQDPSGGWSYNGIMSTSSAREPQLPAYEITCSRVAASIGSALICADLFGLLRGGFVDSAPQSSLPEALQEVRAEQGEELAPLRSASLDQETLFETIQLGDKWMEVNYKVSIELYTSYYMYALERYKSFQELQTGTYPEEPDWYNKGFAYLKESQKQPGVWETGCGPEIDTAFSVLFLLRSTQKAIRQTLGEGTLQSGRGLPTNLAKVKLKGGQLVVEQTKTQISELLDLFDDDQQENLSALVSDDTALVVNDVDATSARRLQQVVRTGSPEARLLSVRALGRTGSLDYVPTLIYALTDPDPHVVREADFALRFVSRRFKGVGLSENFTDRERYDAIDQWKSWFKVLRPDTPIPLE